MTHLKIRISAFKDYVAIDEINEHGKIVNTPFYFTKNKSQILLMKDLELKKWFKTKFTYNGDEIEWEDVDEGSEFLGMKDTLSLRDSYTLAMFKHDIKPND